MPWDKRGVRLQVNYENLAWGRCAGLLLATLGLWGCQAPRLEREPAPVEKAVERSSPDWLRSPLSWEKLGAIESWLEQDAAAHDRGLALEARLQLADGRIELTRRSVKSGAELDAVAHTRVETSRRELLAIEQD